MTSTSDPSISGKWAFGDVSFYTVTLQGLVAVLLAENIDVADKSPLRQMSARSSDTELLS
jgi:hypothetical protein